MNNKTEKGPVLFTEEMKKTHTILVPMMLPIHFRLMQSIFRLEGYKLEVLDFEGPSIIETGLKYMNNDICFPAQLTVGQLMHALLSEKYDSNTTALLLMQTGGGCRASNYVSLLRKALKQADLEHIPVVSLNLVGLEKHPGFQLTLPMIKALALAILYGDLMMSLSNQTRPYEVHEGDTEKAIRELVAILDKEWKNPKLLKNSVIRKNCTTIFETFAKIPVKKVPKIKVGIVGEIYVKFSPLGNNNLEDFLLKEGAEIVVPGLMDFVLYTTDAGIEDYKLYGQNLKHKLLSQWLFNKLEGAQNLILKEFKHYPQFTAPASFKTTKENAKEFIHIGTKMGEGWLLTGEIIELLHSGVDNVVCTQPFGCLPNHVVGKGMFRKVKEAFPEANLVSIDYDASASQVNQENRIKLMLQSAATKDTI